VEGLREGAFDGARDGPDELGDSVGPPVGAWVLGYGEGAIEGLTLGVFEGLLVGELDVGPLDGERVGVDVDGNCDGASDGPRVWCEHAPAVVSRCASASSTVVVYPAAHTCPSESQPQTPETQSREHPNCLHVSAVGDLDGTVDGVMDGDREGNTVGRLVLGTAVGGIVGGGVSLALQRKSYPQTPPASETSQAITPHSLVCLVSQWGSPDLATDPLVAARVVTPVALPARWQLPVLLNQLHLLHTVPTWRTISFFWL